MDDAMVINIPSEMPGIRNMGLAKQLRLPSNPVLPYSKNNSDILKPKRSTLTSMNFGKFVLLKGNTLLLQFKTPEEEDALA